MKVAYSEMIKKSKYEVSVRGDRDIDLSISLYLVTADFAGNKRSSLQAGILTKFGQKSLLDEPTEDRHIAYDQLVIWVCFNLLIYFISSEANNSQFSALYRNEKGTKTNDIDTKFLFG